MVLTYDGCCMNKIGVLGMKERMKQVKAALLTIVIILGMMVLSVMAMAMNTDAYLTKDSTGITDHNSDKTLGILKTSADGVNSDTSESYETLAATAKDDKQFGVNVPESGNDQSSMVIWFIPIMLILGYFIRIFSPITPSEKYSTINEPEKETNEGR